jgi:signal transduction histidine kinase/ligand-binding sensor domain-containing protein/CheY-like chemotaxis protein/AraC-like DNA-binding protein
LAARLLHHQYRFRTLDQKDGLKTPKPTSIFQDSYGFLWVGTEYGLFRYDGYAFAEYYHLPDDPSSLPGNAIAHQGFYEDEDRNLWVATTYHGIARFDRKTEKFQRFQRESGNPNSINFNHITTIQGGGEGSVWIGTTGNGLDLYDSKKDTFIHYRAEDWERSLICSQVIVSLLKARNGDLLIGTSKGLSILDRDGRFHCFRPDPEHPHRLSSGFIPHIFEDKNGRIWIATDNGLNRYTVSGAFERYFPEDQPGMPPGHNYIHRIIQDRDGDFWVGTNAGLLRFFPDRKPHFERAPHVPTDASSIGPGSISDIFEDRSGNLWFATDAGLSVLNKQTAFFNEKNLAQVETALQQAAFGNRIRDMVEVEGRFWFTTEEGLYNFLDGEPVSTFLTGSFNRIHLDRKKRLLAGTVSDTLYVIDPIAVKILELWPKERRAARSKSRPVGLNNTAFAEGRDGTLWLGTKHCLNRFEPNTGRCRQFYSPPLSHSTINDLLIDRQGYLWVATQGGGLNRLSPAEQSRPLQDSLVFQYFTHDSLDIISNDNVLAIYEDCRGRLWVGTEVGLNVRYPDGAWQRFFKKDGLPDEKITAIIEDDNEGIWIATANHGLAKYQDGRFTNFTERDGLSTDFFPGGAALKTSDGLLIFAGDQGINSFDPENINDCSGAGIIYFTDLHLYNRPVEIGGADGLLKQPIYMTEAIEPAYDQKVITLQFAALDFIHQNRRSYRYKVEGLVDDWQYLGKVRELSLALTDIFPKKYKLRVQSACRHGEWDSERTLLISVKAPWYLHWLAFAGYLLVIFGSLYAIYKFRVNRKLAAAETRRLKELDAVKTRLYTNITHEFRTPLTIINSTANSLQAQADYAMRENLKRIQRSGRQLLRLVDQMLDLAKLESGKLSVNWIQGNVIVFLKYLLESFHSLAEAKNISLHFQSGEESLLMDFDAEKLQQIVSNLLSNAVKFTPEGGKISLSVTVQNPAPGSNGIGMVSRQSSALKALLLTVTDTGRGIPADQLEKIFDRFYQVDDSATRSGEGTGIGLTLTRELVKLLEGKITVESELDRGATFSVLLPIRNTAPMSESLPDVDPAGIVGTRNPETSAIARHSLGEGGLTARHSLGDGGLTVRHSLGDSGPTLLIIEDNPDVVYYLSTLLRSDYHLLTAPNGKKGLELARQEMPQLILCDVMMPEMDGYEVTRGLKENLATSHIPIILLTARADFDSRMEGLEQGADAYLAKPFEEKELKLRLKKLLENRERLRQFYTSGAFFSQGAAPSSAQGSKDREFFQQLLSTIKAHLDDPSFTAETLCKAFYMSYATCLRKVKAVTGLTINEYIRQIRIHRAAERLLEAPGQTIVSIAGEVGFVSGAHFSREFSKVMGCSPTEYRRRGRGRADALKQ